MRRALSHAWILSLLLLGGCAPDPPARVERADLGIAITFPGKPSSSHYQDDTPFGRMDWYGYYWMRGRISESFHIQVGNVPKDAPHSRTVPEALEAFESWLRERLGPLDKTPLPADRGPGFRYRARGAEGSRIEGILVIRRGRLHHAQATVAQSEDPRVKAFLESFSVQ